VRLFRAGASSERRGDAERHQADHHRVVSLPDGDEPFYAAFELLTDETTGAFARFN